MSGRAIVIGQRADGWAAYFVDLDAKVHSIGALTGKELWATKVDDHPAAVVSSPPTLGDAFCARCGAVCSAARAVVFARDASEASEIDSRHTNRQTEEWRYCSPNMPSDSLREQPLKRFNRKVAP